MGPALASSSVTEIITELSTSEMFSGHREKYLTLMVLFRTILTLEICEIRCHFIHGKGFGFCFFFFLCGMSKRGKEERYCGTAHKTEMTNKPYMCVCTYLHMRQEGRKWIMVEKKNIFHLKAEHGFLNCTYYMCKVWKLSWGEHVLNLLRNDKIPAATAVKLNLYSTH